MEFSNDQQQSHDPPESAVLSSLYDQIAIDGHLSDTSWRKLTHKLYNTKMNTNNDNMFHGNSNISEHQKISENSFSKLDISVPYCISSDYKYKYIRRKCDCVCYCNNHTNTYKQIRNEDESVEIEYDYHFNGKEFENRTPKYHYDDPIKEVRLLLIMFSLILKV